MDNHKPLQSSHLNSAAFENGTLEVEFKGGKRFTYRNVPETVYRELMAADSPGSFFHHHIKGKHGGTPS